MDVNSSSHQSVLIGSSSRISEVSENDKIVTYRVQTDERREVEFSLPLHNSTTTSEEMNSTSSFSALKTMEAKSSEKESSSTSLSHTTHTDKITPGNSGRYSPVEGSEVLHHLYEDNLVVSSPDSVKADETETIQTHKGEEVEFSLPLQKSTRTSESKNSTSSPLSAHKNMEAKSSGKRGSSESISISLSDTDKITRGNSGRYSPVEGSEVLHHLYEDNLVVSSPDSVKADETETIQTHKGEEVEFSLPLQKSTRTSESKNSTSSPLSAHKNMEAKSSGKRGSSESISISLSDTDKITLGNSGRYSSDEGSEVSEQLPQDNLVVSSSDSEEVERTGNTQTSGNESLISIPLLTQEEEEEEEVTRFENSFLADRIQEDQSAFCSDDTLANFNISVDFDNDTFSSEDYESFSDVSVVTQELSYPHVHFTVGDLSCVQDLKHWSNTNVRVAGQLCVLENSHEWYLQSVGESDGPFRICVDTSLLGCPRHGKHVQVFGELVMLGNVPCILAKFLRNFENVDFFYFHLAVEALKSIPTLPICTREESE